MYLVYFDYQFDYQVIKYVSPSWNDKGSVFQHIPSFYVVFSKRTSYTCTSDGAPGFGFTFQKVLVSLILRLYLAFCTRRLTLTLNSGVA